MNNQNHVVYMNMTYREEFRINGCLSLNSQEKLIDLFDDGNIKDEFIEEYSIDAFESDVNKIEYFLDFDERIFDDLKEKILNLIGDKLDSDTKENIEILFDKQELIDEYNFDTDEIVTAKRSCENLKSNIKDASEAKSNFY